jgi:hypothetical protein
MAPLLDRFKNHVFYERKRMKKLALFLTDVKKIVFSNFPRNFQSFYFLFCLKADRGCYTLETKEAKYYGTYVVSTFTRFITY